MKKLFAFVLVCASFLAKSQSQVCAGSSTTLTATTPASLTSPSYTLLPGGFSSAGGTFVVSPTVTTTYTLITKGTTSANTTGSISVLNTVTVFAQPTVAPSYTQTSCTSTVNGVNLNLTFLPANPVPTYTLAWAANSGTIPNIPNGINTAQQYSAIGAISPGAYQTTITSAGGCSIVVAFTMNPIPAPANFSLIPGGTTFSITCYNPSVSLSTSNPNYTYTWTSNSLGAINSNTILLTSANQGSLTIAATNTTSGCTSTKTLAIIVNTSSPQANITPTTQNITCNLTSITTVTMTALTPTVNITHVITPPQGGAYTANTSTAAYAPQGGTGTYSYCLVDNSNGCSVCKNFTVNSSQGFPTFSLTSTPPGFTIGCNTTSVCTVNIFSASTQPISGGALSYTFLPPGSSTATPSGSLGASSQQTVNIPGTWTVITKDNSSLCESRIPLSIIQNTFGPTFIDVVVPQNILDCNTPSVTLQAISETPNIAYDWVFPGVPGHQATSTLNVVVNNTTTPTPTLIANYTITLKDNNNTCTTSSVIPMFQNLFTPSIKISSGGTVITCATPTIVLTNQSTTGIPATSPYPKNQPVIGYFWQGPSPQVPLNVSTTYVAATVGTYTLTGKDLNNGCIATGTYQIGEARNTPEVQQPSNVPQIDCGAAGGTLSPVYPIAGPYTYTWTAPPGSGATGVATLSTFLAPVAGTYSLLVTNTVNSCATAFTMAITQGSLTGAVVADKEFGYAPLEVTFFNNSYSANNSTSGIVTAWGFGNGTSVITQSAATVAKTIYNTPGIYTVTAYITKNPCKATVTKTITVEAPSKLEIPNVFTPNGDGINDLFFLHTTNLTNISIQIYDRWGHKVYDLDSDKGNIAWDGKNQLGVECAQGTYFYVLKATGKDGQTFDEKGNISLYK